MKGLNAAKWHLLTVATVFIAGLLFNPPTVQAEAAEWSGSLKSLSLYSDDTADDRYQSSKTSSEQIRLNTNWQAVHGWTFETALTYQYLWSSEESNSPPAGHRDNRAFDLDKSWRHGKYSSSRLELDRFSLQWRSKRFDLTLGRQAIGFGRILIFSPLDAIAPFAPDAIDTDVRPGIDALQAIVNYGLDGQFGAILVHSENAQRNTFLATWSDNGAGLDLLMLAGRLRGRDMLGAGLAGSLGSLGLKGEVSVYQGRDTGQPGGDDHGTFALAATEAWYRFNNGLSLVTQYLYNGPGSGNPADYPDILASAPLQEGLTYLLGRHYLMIAPSYEFHPLVTGQGLFIYNIEDRSSLSRATVEISLADNLSLQLFWNWNLGARPAFAASSGTIEPRSEFGLRSDSGGLFLKWFF